jgi:hypothetical protein
MAGRKREGALSKDEKKIVKALLGKGWRNQDIQALLNIGRGATVITQRVASCTSWRTSPTSSFIVVMDECSF